TFDSLNCSVTFPLVADPRNGLVTVPDVPGAVWTNAPPDLLLSPPADPPAVERLTFELWTREEGVALGRLSDLGFAPGHPRYWDDLPRDSELFPPVEDLIVEGARPRPLWVDARHPRFALAGPHADVQFYVPSGMQLLPELF